MTLALYLLDPIPPGDTVVLAGDEGRHAATVKRTRPGEQLLIGDGQGTVLTATVHAVERDRVELVVDTRSFQPPPQLRLVVVQALAKGDRAELAVELLTELGADEIVPWAAANSVTRWDPDRAAKGTDRWQRTAREAAKQSRRAWIPTVHPLASTTQVSARLRAATTALVLHEAAAAGLSGIQLPAAGEVIVVVGPEGGITSEELAAFIATGAGPIRLGESVLRTSTAGGAALAGLSSRLGRWA